MRTLMHLLLITCATALATPTLAAPALVTLSKGSVQIEGKVAPKAPFTLQEGQQLELAEGASIVVLFEGTATRLHGPATVGQDQLKRASIGGNGASSSALEKLLSRKVSVARAGASRGDGLQLVRPVPGGTVLNARSVQWRCSDCGEQQVQVYDFMADKVVWTGSGEGSVEYSGPTLSPGAYLANVGGRDFSFTVANKETRERAELAQKAASAAVASLESQGVNDVAELISIPASIYVEAGLTSDALWMVDAAVVQHPNATDLITLRADYERRAGLYVPGSD
ncbi:MAG: hypothetical protein ACI9MC_002618 [Kiritimatiellia bacterium]|jgi:hypothetical protein